MESSCFTRSFTTGNQLRDVIRKKEAKRKRGGWSRAYGGESFLVDFPVSGSGECFTSSCLGPISFPLDGHLRSFSFFFPPVLSAGHSRRTRERKEGKRKAYMRKPRGDAERWSVRLPSGLGWNVSRANNPSGTRPSPARLERCFTAVHGCDARKRALRKIRPGR